MRPYALSVLSPRQPVRPSFLHAVRHHAGHEVPLLRRPDRGRREILRRLRRGADDRRSDDDTTASSIEPFTSTKRTLTCLRSLLAEKIRQAKATVEGERKQVSVLFVDVKGSMELAEHLDPEAWSQIMQRFFLLFCDSIERFEGFVDKFIGDGAMALFGAPIAHEDHAQ